MHNEFPPLLGLDRLLKFKLENKIFSEIISRKNFFFHIVGTNGKGSLSSGIAQNLRRFNKKVGLFTSPHLVNPSERIRINGVPIGEYKLEEDLDNFSPKLSYFEAVFASAILHFKDCDYVVLEAGLGGRYDATNVITSPLFVGITSISLDHEFYLGDTIEKIATEKIQVIKTCDNVYAYKKDEDLLSKLVKKISYIENLGEFIFQAVNKVIPSVKLENTILPIWPGRFHFVNNILVDGCHNPDGVDFFLENLSKLSQKFDSLVFCGLADKKPEILFSKLSNIGITMHVMPELTERSLTKQEAQSLLNNIPDYLRGEVLNMEKFLQICDANRDKNFIFVGSLYGLGALFNALHFSPWCP